MVGVSLSYHVNEQGIRRVFAFWRHEPIMQDNQPVSFSCTLTLEYR